MARDSRLCPGAIARMSLLLITLSGRIHKERTLETCFWVSYFGCCRSSPVCEMLLFIGELQGVEIGSGGYEEAINLLFEETLATMVITMCPSENILERQHTYNSMSI
ncbi:hypothetical protein QL285_050890 [Trifolium repens]|nr:hypothetical protein QL285_050890 [Trifolium repens]